MKCPKSVRVGAYDVQIIQMEDAEAMAHGIYGHFSPTELIIRINKSLQPVKFIDTLNHELLHACYFVGELEDDDDEEKTVSVIAHIWTQIERDNPKLIKFKQEIYR